MKKHQWTRWILCAGLAALLVTGCKAKEETSEGAADTGATTESDAPTQTPTETKPDATAAANVDGGAAEPVVETPPELPTLAIPHHKFVLDNGLTVIVHEDHKSPIVAVNVWYHVGSKNEVAGRTGFAHLFEHLMFQGSENWKAEYF